MTRILERKDCPVCREATHTGHVAECWRCDGNLPSDCCTWEGHRSAVDEAGFCPVCQH